MQKADIGASAANSHSVRTPTF